MHWFYHLLSNLFIKVELLFTDYKKKLLCNCQVTFVSKTVKIYWLCNLTGNKSNKLNIFEYLEDMQV